MGLRTRAIPRNLPISRPLSSSRVWPPPWRTARPTPQPRPTTGVRASADTGHNQARSNAALPSSTARPRAHAPILPGRVADSPPVTIRLCRSGTVRGSSPSCSRRRIRRWDLCSRDHWSTLLVSSVIALIGADFSSPQAVSWDRLLAWLARHSGTLTLYQTVSASSIFGSGLRLSSASCEGQL